MNELIFSINSWIFGTASIEKICKISSELGVNGIDISGEPELIDMQNVKRELDRYNLVPFCINGNYTDENRCLSHNDKKIRNLAIDYGKKLIDMACFLGSKNVLIVPSQVNKQAFFENKETDYQNAVESIKVIADYATSQDENINILIECVNKYECSLIRSFEDGIKMAQDTEYENVRIIGDTFHMQLEESSGIPSAIKNAGNHWLKHLHLGDNTREVPGKGCLDWREILLSLFDISYGGALSFEPLPNRLSGDDIFAGKLPINKLVEDLRFSINYLKTIFEGIKLGKQDIL